MLNKYMKKSKKKIKMEIIQNLDNKIIKRTNYL